MSLLIYYIINIILLYYHIILTLLYYDMILQVYHYFHTIIMLLYYYFYILVVLLFCYCVAAVAPLSTCPRRPCPESCSPTPATPGRRTWRSRSDTAGTPPTWRSATGEQQQTDKTDTSDEAREGWSTDWLTD